MSLPEAPSGPSRSSSGILYRSKSINDLRSRSRTPLTPSTGSFSRPSTPGYLPPRYRSASVFSSDAAEKAREMEQNRREAAQRCMSSWEALMDKYGGIGVDEDDEVDLLTGEVVVDRGRLSGMANLELGDILGSRSPERDEEEEDEGDEEDDEDRDELAEWVQERREIRPTTPIERPRTREDDADLRAFMRAETERRALNDEDDLDSAPPVALLWKDPRDAGQRREREASVAPWKHGTRVYEASDDLHRSSAPPPSSLAESDHSETEGDGDESDRGRGLPDLDELARSSVHPSAAPARTSATAIARPVPRQIAPLSRRPQASTSSSQSVPAKSNMPTSKKASSSCPVTLDDLFTPTPSPPPARRLQQALHTPIWTARPSLPVSERTLSSVASVQERPSSTMRSTARAPADHRIEERQQAVAGPSRPRVLPNTTLHPSRSIDRAIPLPSSHHYDYNVADDFTQDVLSDQMQAHSKCRSAGSSTASTSLTAPRRPVGHPRKTAVEPASTAASDSAMRPEGSLSRTPEGRRRSLSRTVEVEIPSRPRSESTASASGQIASATRSRVTAMGTSSVRQIRPGRMTPSDHDVHPTVHRPRSRRPDPDDTISVEEHHDGAVSTAQQHVPPRQSPPAPVAPLRPLTTPTTAPTTVKPKRQTTRRTPAPPPSLPVPPPEDVDPPSDTELYFPHLHRLNATTVRFCRLCRAAPADVRRSRCYYCKGRQNANWCVLAKEAGEEITPVRDRNKAVKERKRAMTEAAMSVPPDLDAKVDEVVQVPDGDLAQGAGQGEGGGSGEVPVPRRRGRPSGSGSRSKTIGAAPDPVLRSRGATQAIDPGDITDADPNPDACAVPRDSDLTGAETRIGLARGHAAPSRPANPSTPPRDMPATTSNRSNASKTPSSAKKRKRHTGTMSPIRLDCDSEAEQLYPSMANAFSSPLLTLEDSLPPSSPPQHIDETFRSQVAIPTPSPTASAERRPTPGSSPVVHHRPEPHSYFPTPPLSKGTRSASLASEAEYTLPKTLPRPRLKSILRQSSSTPYLSDYAESDRAQSSSAKRARFSLVPRSPTHDDVSFDEGDLAYPSDDWDSSPVKSWRGGSSTSPSADSIPRELAVRAADAGVQLTGHSGRLPTHLLRALAPSFSAQSMPDLRQASRTVSKRPDTGLMLPPPIPARASTPSTPKRPSPLTQANTAPAAIRRRKPPVHVQEVDTPIVFRKAIPLHVRASRERSMSRARSRSVSVVPRVKYESGSGSDADSEDGDSRRVIRRSVSRKPVEFDDLGPSWGLDDDVC